MGSLEGWVGVAAGLAWGARAAVRAGAPWQLLGTARWEISKRESTRNAHSTEQLLPAVRLFPGGNFMCSELSE